MKYDFFEIFQIIEKLGGVSPLGQSQFLVENKKNFSKYRFLQKLQKLENRGIMFHISPKWNKRYCVRKNRDRLEKATLKSIKSLIACPPIGKTTDFTMCLKVK